MPAHVVLPIVAALFVCFTANTSKPCSTNDVAALLIVAAVLMDLSDATTNSAFTSRSSGRTKMNSSAETKLKTEVTPLPDLRDALEWMIGLWDCTENVIYNGGVQHRFYSRLVCGSGNNGTLLEIGLFDDEECTARNTELDYYQVIHLHNIDAILYYSMLSEMGLLSQQRIDTIHVTKSVDSVKDPTEEALNWLQLYRECEALDWFISPKHYTQLVCNTEGTGLEIGFFLDEHCTVYTPMHTFREFLKYKQSFFMESNQTKDNPEPNRTHYTILSETGLLVTNENAGQEFEDAWYWLEELWDCTEIVNATTLGLQRRIYSQLRCKADRSGGIEIALFSDKNCTQREPKLAFEDMLPYQTPTIATHYDQISRYPYLLKKYIPFDCSTWQNKTKYIDQERYMRAVARTTGVRVTIEDPRVETHFFPRHTGKRCDEEFGDGELGKEASCPEEDSFFQWMHLGDVDVNNEDWYKMERFYDGNRTILEPLFRENWDLLAKDINPIPETAKWSIQRVEGDLMPILQDENFIYLLCPTSARAVSRIGELTMPTPSQARIPIEGISPVYMNQDVWFEDCDDGGAYVIGLDDKVVLFYVDGPDDVVLNRWQCDVDQWERMWISAFGATTVSVETVESAETLTVEFKISDDGSDEDSGADSSKVNDRSDEDFAATTDASISSSGADSSKVNDLSLFLMMVFVTSLLTN